VHCSMTAATRQSFQNSLDCVLRGFRAFNRTEVDLRAVLSKISAWSNCHYPRDQPNSLDVPGLEMLQFTEYRARQIRDSSQAFPNDQGGWCGRCGGLYLNTSGYVRDATDLRRHVMTG
jgi:hypothetical protein